MVNRTPNSASRYQKQQGKLAKDVTRRTLKTKIKVLADQFHAERGESVKEKVRRHWNNLEPFYPMIKTVLSGNGYLQVGENVNMLSLRIDNPLCKFNGFPEATVEEEEDQINNVDISSAESIRIPKKEKLPPYTSWVYVARNERMVKDQSVIGKYQMYFDQNRGEMMICSDNEEEIPKTKVVKHEFTEAEDQILRMAVEEYGSTKEVLSIIKEIVKTNTSQIRERYKKLKDMESMDQHSKDCHCKGCENHLGICMEKSLSGTFETFDKLFCRLCLNFDCAIHGTNQSLIYLSEKHVWSEPEGGRKPCSDQCYLLDKRTTPMEEDSTLPPNEPQSSCKLKGIADDIIIKIGNRYSELNLDAGDKENHTTYPASLKNHGEHASKKLLVSGSFDYSERDEGVMNGQKDPTKKIEFNEMSISREVKADEMIRDSDWSPLERDLYLKGVEMFGKNSCLIATTLLPGLKTCLQVAKYMFAGGDSMIHGSTPNSIMDRNEKINAECIDLEVPSRSRSLRKKGGKPRKFNYTRKSAGLPPRWRKIAYGQNLCNKQYTPCACRGMCGKECSCLLNGTCCEKYCGCSKLCKNRFRGCHCTKSQCKSRLCPCFAANRECDPDVCRNCWVSCGDGTLGEPPRRGDGKCGNMNILLGQKERILLAKSDVIGWGAFAKNPIRKSVCLGEYTGELIPPEEAEKRGKLYDRIDTSFLFNLNNEWVIDARRLGDKLKFANHSSKPNCYAKVMFVGGDHRVGIFAKENIEAGDEIFYDYWYDLDCAPSWALPPAEDNASKKDESNISQSKGKKR